MHPSLRLVIAAALMAVCLSAPPSFAARPDPPDVDALLQHLDDLYRSNSSIARIQIDVTTTRSTRTMRLRAWTRGEEEVLVLIEAPPREAGTATLRVGNNLWNYLPKIARTIRVPPAAMLGSWMGTDFTNDDLVKESSLRKDFAARIDRRSDAPAGWWLTLDVKPGVVGRWARIEVLVSDERLPSRSGVIGILPSELATPFRIEPLVWRVNESAKGTWRHEIDRANAQVHLRRADLTIGRQAIGCGRGVMFTSVDLFAPFSPLEVDREWRSGVDAVRADIKRTDRSSVDLVGAFGDTLDRSAFAARARGYAGTIDLEVVGGRRGQDLFGGVTSSAAVGDAEVHGEAAAFRPSGTDRDVVWKAVVGGSYRFPIGAGILAYAEYHYSGFGAEHPEEIPALLTTPEFVGRVIRGDMQILSRHAVGVTSSYEASPEITYSWQWLRQPRRSIRHRRAGDDVHVQRCRVVARDRLRSVWPTTRTRGAPR